MKKPIISLMLLLFVATVVKAQPGNLMVKSSDKNLYVEHKVMAKENFFAIGRTYNIHPKAIAGFNKLDMNKGLVIGQVLRIPLTDTNFTQKGNSGVPVYYKVSENEGLMKVSSLHHDVTLENLRSWNGLTDNSVKEGSKLIVGFLVSPQMPSTAIAPPKETKTDAPKEIKTEQVIVESPPIVKQTETNFGGTIKEPVPKARPVSVEEPVSPALLAQYTKAMTGSEGYFKNSFEQQLKKKPVSKAETVTSGIFKTTSGWQDEKYYLLIDAVQPGTIVRIINPANNKTVYAKVLGEMSGIRQNEGINIRISNAAASALQVSEVDKFVVKVNY